MIRFHTIDVDQGTIVPLARLWLGLLWLIETGGKGRQLLPGSINGKDQMGPGPDWTLVRYANPHYATKFKPMFILFRQTLVTAVAFVFLWIRGQIRAENLFLLVLFDPGHTGAPLRGVCRQKRAGR